MSHLEHQIFIGPEFPGTEVEGMRRLCRWCGVPESWQAPCRRNSPDAVLPAYMWTREDLERFTGRSWPPGISSLPLPRPQSTFALREEYPPVDHQWWSPREVRQWVQDDAEALAGVHDRFIDGLWVSQ